MKMKNYVKYFADAMDFDDSKNKFALITTGGLDRVHFVFNTFITKAELFDGIDTVEYVGGPAKPATALASVAAISDAASGSKYQGQRIVIYITDSISDEPLSHINRQAEYLKNTFGIVLFTIGVGQGLSDTEFNIIASCPSSTFHYRVNSFDDLSDISDYIVPTVCQLENPNIQPSPTSTAAPPDFAVPVVHYDGNLIFFIL